MNQVNVMLDFFSIAIILCVFGSCMVDRTGDRRQRLYFLCMLITQLLLLGSDTIDWIFNGNPKMNLLLWVSNTVNYSMGYLIVWLFINYLCCFLQREKREGKRIFKFNDMLLITSLILLLFNIKYGIFFFLDKSGFYHQGELYWMSQLLPTIGLLTTSELIIFHTNLSTANKCLFLTFPIFPTMGILADMMISDCSITYQCSTLSLLFIYTFFYLQRCRQIDQQKMDLMQQQVSMMLSQIQPHFLYNSLTAIARLCDLDPKMAKQTTLNFSEYLRGNLNSISQKDPVLFSTELRHTKLYAEIEKTRFGDKLQIEYDIQTENFLIPSLTVQPLVENAVKHGVGRKKEGGTVWLTTRQTPQGWSVTIRDNGVGFDINAPKIDGRSHIGIANVRSRLQMQCGGTLTIDSVPGEGTNAEIWIPKEGKRYENPVRRR